MNEIVNTLVEEIGYEQTIKLGFIAKIIFILICIYFTPVLTEYLRKVTEHSILVETVLIFTEFVGFSVWLCGKSIIGTWTIHVFIAVLLIEISTRIIKEKKEKNLDELKKEKLFSYVNNEVKLFDKYFDLTALYYSSIFLGCFAGITQYWFVGMTRKEFLIFTTKNILWFCLLFTMLFLYISCKKMSQSLHDDSYFQSQIIPQKNIKNTQDLIDAKPLIKQLRNTYFWDGFENAILLTVNSFLLIEIYLIAHNYLFLLLLIIVVMSLITFYYSQGEHNLNDQILNYYPREEQEKRRQQLKEKSSYFPIKIPWHKLGIKSITTINQIGPMGIGHVSGGEIKGNAKIVGVTTEGDGNRIGEKNDDT
jgi:type IV secretory pathway VirB3-like protein